MKALKELYEKGEYEALLNASELSTDPETLLLRISAYLALNRPKEALELLLKHRDELFAFRPGLTMKTNFEIDFALAEFDKAREDLEYYRNAPYVSQAIEEALSSYPKIIREEEKAALLRGYAPIEDFSLSLKSKDPFAVLGALNRLGKGGISGHEGQIEEILISKDIHPDVRSFALQLLCAWNYPKKVAFLSDDGIVEITPKDIVDPFSDPNAKWLKEEFSKLQDLSLGKVCSNLLDQLCLVCYPSTPLKGDSALEYDALLALGEEYLGYPSMPLTEEAAAEKQRFSEVLERHPPLS